MKKKMKKNKIVRSSEGEVVATYPVIPEGEGFQVEVILEEDQDWT